MSINKVFGTRIKSLRKQRKENQDVVAKLIDVDRSAVAKYESRVRMPELDKIIILSQYFNVSINYLLGLTDVPDSQTDDTDAYPKLSIKMFVPENVDLIRGSMTYEEMSNDMSIKMDNPLFKTTFDANYLKCLAKGKVQATYQTIGLLASYAKVDQSFFYRDNTIEGFESAKKDFAVKALQEIDSLLGNEFRAFVVDASSLPYLERAALLKKLDIAPEKLDWLIENFLKDPGDWKYLEFALDIKNKNIDPGEITGFSLKYSK